MNVMVVGGAGYIGSHAAKQLIEKGHEVVVVDNLYRGHRKAVHPDATFYELNIAQRERMTEILKEHAIECVMHFSALTYVGESVDNPLSYYENNTSGTIALLQAMQTAGVKRFVFSSTCATYGEPDDVPITETMSQSPVSPYGWSKRFVEQILLDQVQADPEFAFCAPRYFNVAGAAADGSLGEDHEPETHLIPVILQTLLGQREKVVIFGTDYPTPDGTCVRDYVHVDDLVAAHIAAMEALEPGDARFYNLGIGKGYSVREILDAVERVTGMKIPIEFGERRPGDATTLFANPNKAATELNWTAKLGIDEIVATAWNWHKNHPNGYEDE